MIGGEHERRDAAVPAFGMAVPIARTDDGGRAGCVAVVQRQRRWNREEMVAVLARAVLEQRPGHGNFVLAVAGVQKRGRRNQHIVRSAVPGDEGGGRESRIPAFGMAAPIPGADDRGLGFAVAELQRERGWDGEVVLAGALAAV